MKLKLIFASVIFIGMTFSGCEKIKSLLDVHFDTHFTQNIQVTSNSATKSTASTFSGSAAINPNDDADVAKYGSLIKSFDISKASGTFTSVSEDMTLTNVDLSITSGSQSATWHFDSLPITTGTVISLPNTDGQWDTTNAILGSLNPFTVSISGNTDKDGVQFTLSVSIDATVTANPLGSK